MKVVRKRRRPRYLAGGALVDVEPVGQHQGPPAREHHFPLAPVVEAGEQLDPVRLHSNVVSQGHTSIEGGGGNVGARACGIVP
jgi:hypothetical protein